MSDYVIVGDLQMRRENLRECASLFVQLESLAKERNISEVIWLGDMLDRRGLIEAECLNLLFNYFINSKLHHNVIVGNHDLLSVHSTEHALEPLKAILNVNIYDKPGQLGHLLIMPYYRDSKKFLADIDSWLPKLPEGPVLFCHQGVKEFTIGSGYTEDEAVALSDLSRFHLVIAGHYHTPNQMGNVIYLGSPFSHNFGESNEHKRLGIFNTDTSTISYVTTTFRRHVSVELDLSQGQPLLNFDSSNINRCIVKGTEDEINEFKNSRLPNGVKFVYRPVGESRVAISETLTNKDKWVKWSKDVKQLDDSIITAGLDLLND